MKILFVINNLYTHGNGLNASARRVIKKLKEAGEDVRILSAKNPDKNGPQPEFALEDFPFGIFQPLIEKNGYSFSKANKKVIKKAVEWADVVHVEEPFVLQAKTCSIARKMHKPITGTYHLHPENISANLRLTKLKPLNSLLLAIWKNDIFNKCQIIQCPTDNVYERLRRHHFKAELRVFSNGLVLDELMHPEETTKIEKTSGAKYNVITIGRYSREKNIKTLLKAMKYSHNHDDIQLIIAGKGPKEKSLRKRAQKYVEKGILKYEPIFGFRTLDELQKIASVADLYVHCAYIEVEGLSCMEAIQIGLVPIIAKGRYTATSQFALSQNSVYYRKDAKELAKKIDYWLDHEDLRHSEAKKYRDLGQRYNIDYSIKRMIEMFHDAKEMVDKKYKK